ncbi:MAG: manganese efflux pump [Eubacterium sp.]
MLWIILLALSATIDSWAVAMTYKSQKIRIPLLAKGVISMVSGITALVAVLFGRLLSEVLPMAALQGFGGTLLAAMGIRTLWQIRKEKEKHNYDRDLSQQIEMWEAVWMGTILSLDSFLVGIGLMQYGWQAYAFPALVTGFTAIFLMLAQGICYKKIFDYGSALLLIAAGICQWLTIS